MPLRYLVANRKLGSPSRGLVGSPIGGKPPVVYATLDLATVAAVILSGGNLVATNTGTTATNQGARVANASGKTTGKYYFEGIWTTIVNGANRGIGIGTIASTYTGMGDTGGVTGILQFVSNTVWSNGALVVTFSGGGWTFGQVMGLAVDLDIRRIWFRHSPAGIWNDNAANNPVTNVGGLVIPAGTMVPFITFGGAAGAAGNVVTTNFGGSAFSGAVPSGFTAGWPV